MKKLRSERVRYFPQTTQLAIDGSGTGNQVLRLQLQSISLPGPHSLPDQAITHSGYSYRAVITMAATTLRSSTSFGSVAIVIPTAAASGLTHSSSSRNGSPVLDSHVPCGLQEEETIALKVRGGCTATCS